MHQITIGLRKITTMSTWNIYTYAKKGKLQKKRFN